MRNPAVIVFAEPDGYWVLHLESNKLHRLNAEAALISELANGQRDMVEIEALMAPLLPAGSDRAVSEWVARAEAAGLLIDPAAASRKVKRPALSAKGWSQRSSKLRDAGKIKAAFLCRRKAAELEPGRATTWSALGELVHILGQRADALAAFERYLELSPGDAEVEHLVTSLRDDPPPARAPDECVRTLYKRFSSFYETNMCDELGYEAPERIRELLDDILEQRRDLEVLELGCGSGLAGAVLRNRARHLSGIDLSPEMVELARKREIYDELAVAEITAWQAVGRRFKSCRARHNPFIINKPVGGHSNTAPF